MRPGVVVASALALAALAPLGRRERHRGAKFGRDASDGDEGLDLPLVAAPGGGKGPGRGWSGPCGGLELGEARKDDAGLDLGEEAGEAPASGRDAIGVVALDAFDEALAPQAAKVVGGLAAGVGPIEERPHERHQRGVGQAALDVAEAGDGQAGAPVATSPRGVGLDATATFLRGG